MELKSFCFPIAGGVLSALLALPAVAANNVVANPICPDNTANFNPTLAPSIDLPPGFTASVFASGLNFPTGVAFLGDSQNFQVFVLESGHGLGGGAGATSSGQSRGATSLRITPSHPTSWYSTETGP